MGDKLIGWINKLEPIERQHIKKQPGGE